MLKHALGYKYHWALADYLQRSARHIASAVDVRQAYAVGREATERALLGETSVMISIRRTLQSNYDWSLETVPLLHVANTEKCMPSDFIRHDGFGITQKARHYLEPLIVGESYPPYINGLPFYVTLKNTLTPKRLKKAFNT